MATAKQKKQQNRFKKAAAKAKKLYKSGKYDKYSDAMKAALSGTKVKRYQTGKSDKKRDSDRQAKAPGKRRSKSGRTYIERRKNRSDMPGKLTGNERLKAIGKALQGIKVSKEKPGSNWRLYDGARTIEQAADMVEGIKAAGFDSRVWQLKPGNDGYAIGFRYYVYVPKNSWM